MFWSNDSNRCMHARYMCRTYMWMSKSWIGKLHYLIMYVSVTRTHSTQGTSHARHTHAQQARTQRALLHCAHPEVGCAAEVGCAVCQKGSNRHRYRGAVYSVCAAISSALLEYLYDWAALGAGAL